MIRFFSALHGAQRGDRILRKLDGWYSELVSFNDHLVSPSSLDYGRKTTLHVLILECGPRVMTLSLDPAFDRA